MSKYLNSQRIMIISQDESAIDVTNEVVPLDWGCIINTRFNRFNNDVGKEINRVIKEMKVEEIVVLDKINSNDFKIFMNKLKKEGFDIQYKEENQLENIGISTLKL